MKGKRSNDRENNLAEKYSATSGECTTVMIRNIPNEYTQDELIQEVTETMNSTDLFDFFYLPWDSQNGGNAGYAFVNFHDNQTAKKAVRMFSSYKFQRHESKKTGKVAPAHIQGLENNLRHLRDRAVVYGNHPCSPVVMWRGQKVELSAVFQELRAQDALQKFAGSTGETSTGNVQKQAASSPGLGGKSVTKPQPQRGDNGMMMPPSSAPGHSGTFGSQGQMMTGGPQRQRPPASTGNLHDYDVGRSYHDYDDQRPGFLGGPDFARRQSGGNAPLDFFEDDTQDDDQYAGRQQEVPMRTAPQSAPHLTQLARQQLQPLQAQAERRLAPPGSAAGGFAGGYTVNTLSSRFGIHSLPRAPNPLSMDPSHGGRLAAIDTTSGSSGDFQNNNQVVGPASVQPTMAGAGMQGASYIAPPHSDPGARRLPPPGLDGPPPGLYGGQGAPPGMQMNWRTPGLSGGERPTTPSAPTDWPAESLGQTVLGYASPKEPEGGASIGAKGEDLPPSVLAKSAGGLGSPFSSGGAGGGGGGVALANNFGPTGAGLEEMGQTQAKATGPIEMAVTSADEDVMKKFFSKFDI